MFLSSTPDQYNPSNMMLAISFVEQICWSVSFHPSLFSTIKPVCLLNMLFNVIMTINILAVNNERILHHWEHWPVTQYISEHTHCFTIWGPVVSYRKNVDNIVFNIHIWVINCSIAFQCLYLSHKLQRIICIIKFY